MFNFGTVLIDDLRSFITPPAELVTLRTLEAAMSWLEPLGPDDVIEQLWLDHDLGTDSAGNVTEIKTFVNELERKAFFGEAPAITQIYVQSSNGPGAQDTVRALERFYRIRRQSPDGIFLAH